MMASSSRAVEGYPDPGPAVLRGPRIHSRAPAGACTPGPGGLEYPPESRARQRAPTVTSGEGPRVIPKSARRTRQTSDGLMNYRPDVEGFVR